MTTRAALLDHVWTLLNELGLGRGTTVASVQRRLRVNAQDAMRLFALREATMSAFAGWNALAAHEDAGTVPLLNPNAPPDSLINNAAFHLRNLQETVRAEHAEIQRLGDELGVPKPHDREGHTGPHSPFSIIAALRERLQPEDAGATAALSDLPRIVNEMRLSAKACGPFAGQAMAAALSGWADQIERSQPSPPRVLSREAVAELIASVPHDRMCCHIGCSDRCVHARFLRLCPADAPAQEPGAQPTREQVEVCLGCGAETAKRDCGCPAGTGWSAPR